MSLKDSKTCSLAAALAEPRPHHVFEPSEFHSAKDLVLLHDRISQYFSISGSILKRSLITCARLQKLAQECAGGEWSEAKMEQYQKQKKYSMVQQNDTHNFSKDPFDNLPPFVTDAEVRDFIKALSPAQLKKLNHIRALERLDGFDYMWDLQAVHDSAVRKRGLNTHAFFGHDMPLPASCVTHRPIPEQPDEFKVSKAFPAPMGSPSLSSITHNQDVDVDVSTTATILTEPLCTVEVAYDIDSDAVNILSDDASTDSFCRFSRIAMARADKVGQFEDPSRSCTPSTPAITHSLLSRGHFFQRNSMSVTPSKSGVLPQLNRVPALSELALDRVNITIPGSAESESEGSAECALHTQTFGLTPINRDHAGGNFCNANLQNTHIKACDDRRCVKGLLTEYVRSIIMVNRMREKGEVGLRREIYEEAQQEISTILSESILSIEQLLTLLKEANIILPALNSLDRAVLSEHISNPSYFLLTPRYVLRCFNIKCGVAFSKTVTRLRCGRCGQFFCSHCCREQGLGPDIHFGDHSVSLGWEPICLLCWNVCRAWQMKKNNEYFHRPSTPSCINSKNARILPTFRSSISECNQDFVVLDYNIVSSAEYYKKRFPHNIISESADMIRNQERLEDGFAIFHVITGERDHSSLSESWTYRIARMRSSMDCLMRSTVILAKKVAVSARMRLKNRQTLY